MVNGHKTILHIKESVLKRCCVMKKKRLNKPITNQTVYKSKMLLIWLYYGLLHKMWLGNNSLYTELCIFYAIFLRLGNYRWQFQDCSKRHIWNIAISKHASSTVIDRSSKGQLGSATQLYSTMGMIKAPGSLSEQLNCYCSIKAKAIRKSSKNQLA